MKGILVALCLASFIGGCTYWVIFSDDAKRAEQQERAQEIADSTPHAIRQVDGCKVYAFKAAGNWHYFTRCIDGTVTTERNWTESHREGKQTLTAHKSETIETKEYR